MQSGLFDVLQPARMSARRDTTSGRPCSRFKNPRRRRRCRRRRRSNTNTD